MHKNYIEKFNWQNKECFMPQYYIIEPTNLCNYKCIMCPNNLYKDEQKGYMNFDLFKDIIYQIKDYAKYIQLYWMGEPLLHPQIIDMISYIKINTDIKVVLSTNGSLLDSDISKELITKGLDVLIISLDAAVSNNIYANIRIGGDLDLVKSNTFEFLNMNKKVRVIIQMISFYENSKEWDILKKLFESYKCDIQLSWLDTWANQFPGLSKLSDRLSPNKNIERQPCSDLWYKAAIHWNGEVSICCHDWNYKMLLGDINKSTMKDIWNSNKINSFRKTHYTKKFGQMKFCEKCIEWATVSEYDEF